VAANNANTDHFAVDILGVIGVNVAGAAAAVRNFGARHGVLGEESATGSARWCEGVFCLSEG
jgi:hypothetical protein